MSVLPKNRLITAIAAMLVTILISPPVLSESYKISQIRYANRGDYVACPEVNWNDASGRRQVSPLDCVKWGHSLTFDLADIKNPPTAGSEVWLVVRIAAGQVKDCRTGKATFHFDPGGARAKFRTDGTALDRNDCQLMCEDCKAR